MRIFEWPFQVTLDEQNRWGRLSRWFPWNAFNEGSGKQSQDVAYREHRDCYPGSVPGDPDYGTRASHRYPEQPGIRSADKARGRAWQVTEANRKS
jgi:hypothetical protein